MPWTTPKTWAVNELLTAAGLNTHLRDNLNALKDPPSAVWNIERDYATTSTGHVDIDATRLSLTITTNGGDVMVGFVAQMAISPSTQLINLLLAVDGATVAWLVSTGVANYHPVGFVWIVPGLSAGTHNFKLRWAVSGGTGSLFGAGPKGQFWVREVS